MGFNVGNCGRGQKPEVRVVTWDKQSQEDTTALNLEWQREEAAFWVTRGIWNQDRPVLCELEPKRKCSSQKRNILRQRITCPSCPPISLQCFPLAESIWKLDDKGAWKDSLQESASDQDNGWSLWASISLLWGSWLRSQLWVFLTLCQPNKEIEERFWLIKMIPIAIIYWALMFMHCCI